MRAARKTKGAQVEKSVDRPTQDEHGEKPGGKKQADPDGFWQCGCVAIIDEGACYDGAKPEKSDAQEHVPECYAPLATE